MKLHYRFYKMKDRGGILFMHQRSGFAFGSEIIERTHDTFLLYLHQIIGDQNSTKIGVVDDLNIPEIKTVESAKIRALHSLPQSSQYWGSELFMVHYNTDAVYIKLPVWMRVKYSFNSELFELEANSNWQVINKYQSLFIDIRHDNAETGFFMSRGNGSLRLAPQLAAPNLQANLCWTVSNHEAA